MAADEWRMCVDWLVRCNILPDDHRAKKTDAQAFDLAQALRDGVLLCHLLNNLKPGCVDARDFSPRPQLSPFVCLKNIRTFLLTCERVFHVKSQDLFEAPDLFDVKNFRKVLHTLSKLSKTELASSKQRGFPSDNRQIHEHEYYNALEDLAQGFPPECHHSNNNEEDIYGNLQDLALENDLADNEELYDSVYQEEDDDIYEDLCSARRKPRQSVSELPPPVTKRDYCIKEMVDTERNYVDALRMIVQHFIRPLKSVITPQESKHVFSNIESLLEVHSGFHSELHRACTTNRPKISDVFINWKSKFLLYGDYCSNLPRAQELIEEFTKRNEAYRQQIEECEKKANEGRFRLRDLLHVPMQRVLKYHLLLKELKKNTDKVSEEWKGLETALEAMQDLSLYINEVKRDNEALQLIQDIQDSITDLQMPNNTSLKDYGRLQKDGELKVRSHVENKVRPRYIFLFDKVMLMAKSKGETYSFKEAIVLAEYKVDDTPTTRDRERRPDKWNCSFQMVKRDNKMAYTFFAKTDDMKSKWIESINLALDNTQPSASPNFVMTTFPEPTVCDVCGKLLRGVFFQGYKCPDSKKNVHKECIGKTPPEQVPSVPPRLTDKVRAVVEYQGDPNPGLRRKPLKFKKDDVIEVLNRSDNGWCMGRFRGDEGWFPEGRVEEMESRMTGPMPCPLHPIMTELTASQLDGRRLLSLPDHESLNRKPSYLRWQVTGPPQGADKHLTPEPCTPAHRSYVNIDQYKKYEWYVGKMAREESTELLKKHPNGTFLIRFSINPARPGEPALSIKYSNNVRHIRVERNQEGSYYMSDSRFFHSLPELVDYYQKNPLTDSFPEVNTALLYPYKSVATPNGVLPSSPALERGATSRSHHLPPKSPGLSASGTRILSMAVAVYDYSATATSQLTLKKGDRVSVTSKTGSDRGWWKGEHCATGRVGYFPFAYVQEEEED